MNSQKIVDYVMNTPHNTNPAILKQMIDANGTGNKISWNDLVDKPFGEEQAFEPIVWDGDTESKEAIDIGALLGVDTFPIFKVAPLTGKFGKLDGATICDTSKASTPDMRTSSILTAFDLQSDTVRAYEFTFAYLTNYDDGEWTTYCWGVVAEVGPDNEYGLSEGVYIGEKGEGPENNPLKIYKEITKPLDEKYLPESVKGGGSAGGAFVLRPTEDELSVTEDSMNIMCTTNYDEMLKAMEAGALVYVLLPESFGTSGMGVKEMVLLISWVYASADGMTAILARFMNFSNITNDVFANIVFTNGTYAPNL